MKNFSYTAKASDGSLKRGVLSAADRAAVLEALRRQSLMPVAVEEAAASAERRALPTRALAYAALAVLLLAGGAWLVLSRRAAPSTTGGREALPHTAAARPTASAQSAQSALSDVSESPPPTQSDPSAFPAPALAVPSPTPTAATARSRSTTTAEAPPDEKTQEPPRPQAFKTATEQLIAMAFSVPPGKSMPPLPVPPGLDDDFAVSLTNQIIVFDDDDEKTVALKEEVALAKLDILGMIKEGKSVADVLKEYEQDNNERAAIRSEAEKELRDMLKSGKRAEAEDYLRSINQAFREHGIEPVSMP